MGKSEKVSQPPTSTAVAVPEMIFSAPEVMPRLLEIQAIDTVWAGMLLGKPDLRGAHTHIHTFVTNLYKAYIHTYTCP